MPNEINDLYYTVCTLIASQFAFAVFVTSFTLGCVNICILKRAIKLTADLRRSSAAHFQIHIFYSWTINEKNNPEWFFLILALIASKLTLSLKQAVFAPPTLSQLSSDWLFITNRRFEQLVRKGESPCKYFMCWTLKDWTIWMRGKIMSSSWCDWAE